MSPIILVGAAILLIGLGVGLGFWLSHGLRKNEASKAADVQKELDEYRRHVTEHFGETAQHFKALGQQYQSLYKHMAHGAEALCDPAQSDALLEFPAGDTAALATDIDQTEAAPESIKDYAPMDKKSTAPKKTEKKEPETLTAATDAGKTDAKVDDLKAKEELASPIEKAATDKAERTVH